MNTVSSYLDDELLSDPSVDTTTESKESLVIALEKGLREKLKPLLTEKRKELTDARAFLQEQLGTQGVDKVKIALNGSLEILDRLSNLEETTLATSQKISLNVDKLWPILEELKPMVKSLKKDTKVIAYLRKVLEVQKLDSLKEIEGLPRDQTLTNVAEFLKLYRSLNSSHPSGLEQIFRVKVNESVASLQKVLLSETTSILKHVKYGAGTEFSIQREEIVLLKKLVEMIISLHIIGMENEMKKQEQILVDVEIDCDGLISVFVKPIITRFRYHFSGKKKTNRVDKPQWFIQYFLEAIKAHIAPVSDCIQPSALKACGNSKMKVLVDLRSAMIRSLIQNCIHWRLEKSYATLENSHALFCHTIDQLIAADQELENVYEYAAYVNKPAVWPRLISFFCTTDARMKRWVEADASFARRKVNEVLAESGAWDGFIPESCFDIVNLLKKVSARFKDRLSPEFAFRFVTGIQLPVIEAYRIAVEKSLINVATHVRHDPMLHQQEILGFCKGINALSHLRSVMVEWAQESTFSLIQDWKAKSERSIRSRLSADIDEEGGVFSKEVDIIDTVVTTCIKRLGDMSAEMFRNGMQQILTRAEVTEGSALFPESFLNETAATLELYKNNLFPQVADSIAKEFANGIVKAVSDFVSTRKLSEKIILILREEMHKVYNLFQPFSKSPENRFFRELRDVL